MNDNRERSWIAPACMILALGYVVAFLIGVSVGFVIPFQITKLLLAAFTISILALGFYCIGRALWFAHLGEQRPTRRLVAELPAMMDLPILAGMVAAQLALLAWLKATMPIAVGFWADPALASIDGALFGIDPWRLVPSAWLALFDRFYATWAPVSLAILLALALAPRSRKRSRAIVAYFLLILLSAVGQYLLPSAGPVFYQLAGHGDRFAALPVQPWTATTAAYLWDSYLSPVGNIGVGISAMPSVHVGGAAWVALTAGAFAPRLKPLGWAFFIAILVGSVALGWHYAVDGFAGLLIALASWALASRLVRPVPLPVPQSPYLVSR